MATGWISAGWRRYIALALAAGLIATVLALGGWLKPLDNALAEARFELTPRAPSGSIVLLDIDARSLQAIGTWPWPRSVHGRIVDALRAAGAADIAFDIDFSAASDTAEDAAFEAALDRAGGSVVLAAFNQLASAGDSAVQANLPLPRFRDRAWLAAVNVEADGDGVVRHAITGEAIQGMAVPSLSALLGNYSGAVGKPFLIDFGIEAAGIDRISVIDLLQGTVPPERLAGKKVIVGAAAIELRDFFNVPVFGIVSGPMLQALAAESLLQARALQPSPWWFWPLGLGALTLFAILFLGRFGWKMEVAALVLLAGAVEGAAWLVQARLPLVLQTAPLDVALILTLLAVLVGEIGMRRVLLLIARTEANKAETILERVFADNFAGVVVIAEDLRLYAVNRAAGDILAVSPLPARGADLSGVLPKPLLQEIRAALASYRRGAWQPRPAAVLELERAGEARLVEYSVTPSHLEGGYGADGQAVKDGIIVTVSLLDVTEKHRAEEQLAFLAEFDGLTGLPNRHGFARRVAVLRLDARAAQQSVAMIGICNLGHLTALFGPAAGEALVLAARDRVHALLGPAVELARPAPHVLALVLDGGREAATALLQKLVMPYEIGERRLTLDARIGLAGLVLRDAELALAQAVDTNEAVLLHTAEAEARILGRQQMEADLRMALARNEFHLVYQPQVDLRTNELTGVEALIRWRHPERGVISPAEFIPVAEDIGLTVPIGAWVLNEATTTVARWPGELKLSVNVAPAQFVSGDLAETVTRALRRSGLPARQLDLEITEGTLIAEMDRVRATMAALRAEGVSFAIDDFGTGYSSLGYLRDLRVQKLKIDRSFVTGLPACSASKAIIAALAELVRNLGVRLNAEGVETMEQATTLRTLGCDEGQGWLFGKPVSSEAIIAMIQSEGRTGEEASACA